MLALLLLTLAPAPLPQDSTEQLSEALPDGGWVEREVERGPDGEAINHGGYKSWWDSEQQLPRATGRYAHGQRRATWRTYYPDKRRASKGKYEADLRIGEWNYWTPEGEPDPERSGEYSVATLTHSNGEVFAHGELRNGVRNGRWTLTWANGAHMAAGQVHRSQLAGIWVFHHPDGTPDPDWISGDYARGQRVRALTPEQRSSLTASVPDSPAADALLGPISLGGHGADVLDGLRNLLRLELSDAEQVAIGTRLVGLLAEATGGPTFLWSPGATPDDAAANRLSSLRWASFWTLLAIHPDYANFDCPVQLAKLVPVGETQPLEALHPPLLPSDTRAQAANSAPLATRFERAARSGKSGRAADAALASALDWLVRHQTLDGGWSAAGFSGMCPTDGATCSGPGHEHVDVGITGLSLLALLGDGNTTRAGPHSASVAHGLSWLLAGQDGETGLYGGFAGYSTIYQQGIATVAVCEAALLSGNSTLLDSAQRGIECIQRARNPHGAWRYELVPEGNNDTSVTAWMIQALDAATRAGLRVDAEALVGAVTWMDEMTDPATGRAGYADRGSASARIEGKNDYYPTDKAEALTGAALLSRFLLGQRLDSSPIMERHADLLLTKLPLWDPDGFGCDMYAWYYGSQAMYQVDEARWTVWESALEEALIGSQQQEGHAAGSWDPVGPWGFSGGRVYSTALMALCLEAPHRLARLSELDEEQ